MSNTTENTGKCLGQLRPGDTNAASLYSPAAGINAEIETIIIAETGGTNRTFRIFHDDDGTTYDQTTALYYDVAINANTTKRLPDNGPLGIWMRQSTGNLAVSSSFADALTFTVYGIEHTRVARQTFPRGQT